MKDKGMFSKNILKSAIREVLFEIKTPGSATSPPSAGAPAATQQVPVYVADLQAHLDAVRAAATTIKQADTDIGEISAKDIGPDPDANIIALESNLGSLIGIDSQRPGHPPFALLLLAKSYADNDYTWINESRKRKKNLLNEGGIPVAVADNLTTKFASTALRGLRSALGDRGLKVVTDAEFEKLLMNKSGVPLGFASGAFEAATSRSRPADLLKRAAEVAASESPVTSEIGEIYLSSIRRVINTDPQYADFNRQYIGELEDIVSNAIENKRSLSVLDDQIRELETRMGGYFSQIKSPLEELIELTSTKIDDVLSTGAAAGLSRGYARLAAVGGIRTAQIATSPAVVLWRGVAAWGNSFAKKPASTLGWTALGGTALATALLAYRYFDEPENPLKKFGTEVDTIRAKIVQRTTPFESQDFSNLKADVSIIADALLVVETVASTESKFPSDQYMNIRKARLTYENIESALQGQGPLMYSGVEGQSY